MDLTRIREQINRVDRQMEELFLERMACAAQVAESKRHTQKKVYAPEREQEILMRFGRETDGLNEERRAFFRQMMGISRAYQYARLAEGNGLLEALPEGKGEAALKFSCKIEDGLFTAALNSVLMSGLCVAEMEAKQSRGDKCGGRLILTGDFSAAPARAAVAQILEELNGELVWVKEAAMQASDRL